MATRGSSCATARAGKNTRCNYLVRPRLLYGAIDVGLASAPFDESANPWLERFVCLRCQEQHLEKSVPVVHDNDNDDDGWIESNIVFTISLHTYEPSKCNEICVPKKS